MHYPSTGTPEDTFYFQTLAVDCYPPAPGAECPGRAWRTKEPSRTARHALRTTMIMSDGVPLHVDEVGPDNAALTLVFVRGFRMTADA